MTDKKVFQLVSASKPADKITPEIKKALDEMYAEILTGECDFVMIVGEQDNSDGEEGVSFMTNQDNAGCNLMLDQVKFNILAGALMGLAE